MVGSAGVDRFTSRRNDRVTYILRAPENRHRFGISAVALGRHEIFTAGRDGAVRAWNLPNIPAPAEKPSLVPTKPVAKATKTFDEHVDWVNDAILVHGYERLVSASSDKTLKVWNANDPSRSLRTLVDHTDYVKALANVPNGVASGSLDGRVLVWDLVTGRVRTECCIDSEEGSRGGSVYCMAGLVDGNILVSGSTDKTISVWDIRSGDRVVHLRGHSDSVRCLTMKHDARLMLSGATDSTVKLWDLRLQRCVRSFDSYGAGSIWAVTATRDFDRFISGGRDGSVWHTDMTTELASAIVPPAQNDIRNKMVLDLALSPCSTAVWVSTTGSSVKLWPLRSAENQDMSEVMEGSFRLSGRSVDATAEEMEGFSFKADSGLPLYTLPGLPGIVAHRTMNDRRHVLTCDTERKYAVWDITRGVLEKSLGVFDNLDIDDVLKKFDTEVSVPSWFQVDIRLGSLSVRLDRGTISNAEIYAIDAGLDVSSEDVKVNVGEHVVQGLFRKWCEGYKKRRPLDYDDESSLGRSSGSSPPKGTGPRTPDLPPYVFQDEIPVVVTNDRSPVPSLRKSIGSFQGNEEDKMPEWVVDILRDGRGQTREVVKISFSLDPEEGSGLPQLGTNSLNAPRVLRVRKVALYVAKELKDNRNGFDYPVEAEDLDILCNGQPLPPAMSLATVRQFRWRSPEDLHLQFRLRKDF